MNTKNKPEEKFGPFQSYGPYKPVINNRRERENSIKNNTPAIFSIYSSGKKIDFWDEIYHLDILGKNAVHKNDKAIMKYAEKYNIDPDITRAVMYAENARGHKLGLDVGGDTIRKSNSPHPMNIQKQRWSSLLDKKSEDMYDPDVNIEASTLLLKRIHDRVVSPTPEKIGSIWHFVGAEETDEFGDYVGNLYRKKPWKKLD